jgi:hypothetical protein
MRALLSHLIRSGCVAALFLVSPLAISADAMITDMSGPPALIKTGKAIGLLDTLDVNAQLTLDRNASITLVYLKSGDEFQISGPAAITLRAEAPAVQGGTLQRRASPLADDHNRQALNNGRLTRGAVVMRGAPESALAAMQPQGKLLEAPAHFAWSLPSSEGRATFRLADADSGDILFEKETTDNHVILPDSVSLEAGKTYLWRIDLRHGDARPLGNSASFTLADDAERARLIRQRPATDASFSDRLLFAVLLEQDDFHSDARACWQTLAQERPTLTALRERAGQ